MPYDSFLLRIWPAREAAVGAAPWRAILVRIQDGAKQTFTEPGQLLAFLQGRAVDAWHAPDEREQGHP